MTFEASFTPTDEGFDYPGKFVGLLQELDSRFGTAGAFGGTLEVDGAFTAKGAVTLGDAAGDALTVAGNAVTWSGNPTHSGNHTFSGNVTVNGNTTIGNASGDTLTVAPNAVTWSNNPTHSGNHTFSGTVSMAPGVSIGAANPATIGGLRFSMDASTLTNNAVYYRNAGNSADLPLIGWASGNIINLGGPSNGDINYTVATGQAHRLRVNTTDIAVVTSTGLTVTGLTLTTASATGGAGFRLPHGAAPTSPVDGDMWTTTTALLVRINGVTKTVTLT